MLASVVADGIIRATHDLVAECRNSITFFVNISDGINDPVGPHTVHVDLNGNNEAPDITNLDTSIQVPEDTPVGDVMRAIVATDDDNTNKLTYSLAASPTANLAYFTVDVTDVNEAPDLYPKDASYETYEGSISVSVPWNVQDPDFYDSATYTIIEGNDLGRFRIDQSTGQIKSNIDYDVDNNAMPQTVTLRVKVEDKGGLSDNTTVTLNILDANDNRPAIVNRDHDYTVGLCNARAGVHDSIRSHCCSHGSADDNPARYDDDNSSSDNHSRAVDR
nr:hypothetical protein BaRGS_012050 [Batillaria attramentaria]